MEPNSYFKTTCAHCGGNVEAPADGEGLWIRCPHCGEKMQLTETLSAERSSAVGTSTQTSNSKRRLWIFLAVIFLLFLAAGLFIVTRFIQMRRETMEPIRISVHTESGGSNSGVTPAAAPEPDLWKGLKPGPVTIEKSSKSRLVYAFVTVRNDTDKQRFGVKVAFDILDAGGEKLGTTGDYAQFIDAHKEWTAKAIVAFPKAVTAKIASITED